MSIPARRGPESPPLRHTEEGVTPSRSPRDHGALLAAAAANPAVSDRQMRVYTVVVALDREVTAADVAAHLPSIEEDQAAQLLGHLVSAGLMRKRLRTVGYKDGNRVRRGAYSLVGGEGR